MTKYDVTNPHPDCRTSYSPRCPNCGQPIDLLRTLDPTYHKDCNNTPTTPTPAAPAQLANTPDTRDRIVLAALDLAAQASDEYPGFLRLQALNGRIGALGTANGPWQLDIFDTPAQEEVGTPIDARDVPASHAQTPEGLARYCVGILAGIFEYTAYASEREMRAAKRAERQARNPGNR